MSGKRRNIAKVTSGLRPSEAARGFILSAAILLLLSGCSKQDNEKPVANQVPNVEQSEREEQGSMLISGIWADNPEMRNYLEQQVHAFNYEHPTATVQLRYIETSDENEVQRLVDLIQNQYITRDVVRISPQIYHAVAKQVGDANWGRKFLVDFSRDAAFVTAHDAAALRQAGESAKSMGGLITGPVLNGIYEGVWYNRVAGERLGLEIPGPSLSYLQLLNTVVTLNETAQWSGRKGMVLFNWGADMTARMKLFNMLYLSGFVDEEGSLPKARPNRLARDRALLRTLRAFKELSEYNSAESAAGEPPVKEFIEGRSLFLFGDTSTYQKLRDQGGEAFLEQVALLEVVGFEPLNYVCGQYQMPWAILKDSVFCEDAKAFMHHLIQPEVAAGIMQRSQNPCGLKKYQYEPIYALDALGIYRKQMSETPNRPLLDLYESARSRMGEDAPPDELLEKTLRRLCEGKETVDEAFKTLAR